jgi:hypothetical protein
MGNYKTDNSSKQDLPAFAGVQEAIDSVQYHRSMGLTKSGLAYFIFV